MTDGSALIRAEPAEIGLEGPEILHEGYRTLEGWTVRIDAGARGEIEQHREVLRAGGAVGVIPIDLKRGELVLIRQFRLAAHLATGKGDLSEIVAGRVEPGEDLAEAARRELEEETGLHALKLRQLFAFLPTPGVVDEHTTLFLALVDASNLQAEAGAPDEHEITRPYAVPLEDAILAIASPPTLNSYLLIALQWLALNRARLPELLEEDG